MIACRERAKSYLGGGWALGLLVKECLRQALDGGLIGSLDVAGKALALSACGWAR